MTVPSRSLAKELREALAILKNIGIECALVGGLAVAFRAIERATRDVDLAVAVDDDESAELVVRAFIGRGYSLKMLLEHSKTGRIATARLVREGTVIIDLLFASCGIEPEIVSAAEVIEVLPKVDCRVATRAHLIAMKVLSYNDTDRIRDRDDSISMLKESQPSELVVAKQAIQLITKRGCNRGKDLTLELKKLLKIAKSKPEAMRTRRLSKK